MTHPFHPLCGKTFEYLGRREAWGEERVYVTDADGRLRLFPATWTDAAAPDPFVVRAAGRSAFRAEDLVRLAGLLATLGRVGCQGNDAAGDRGMTPERVV